jgi:hypothetical protein
MKTRRIVLLGAAFGVGLAVGGGAVWSIQPEQLATHSAAIAVSDDIQVTSVPSPEPSLVQTTAQQPLVESTIDWAKVTDQSGYRVHLQALTFIDSASEPELIALVKSIEANAQRRYQHNFLYSAAIQRWSEINSRAVVQHIRQANSTDPHGEIGVRIEAIKALSRTDSQVAWQLASEYQAQGQQGGFIAAEIHAVLAQADPKATLEKIISSGRNGGLGNDLGSGLGDSKLQESIERILMEWSSIDPVAALNWMEQNPDVLTQRYVEESALSHLMHSDPQAGLDRLSRTTDPQLRNMLEAEYVSQLAIHSPEQAYQWAAGLSNSATRLSAQQNALFAWVYKAPDDALSFVELLSVNELDHHTRQTLYAAAASHKMDIDPMGTMTWLDTLPADLQDSTRSAAFQHWFSMAPDNAMQWLDAIADYQQRQAMLDTVAPLLPDQHLDLAIQLYPEQSAMTQSQMAYGIVDQLYRQDPDRAMQWVDSLPDGQANFEPRQALLMLLAYEQPELALNRAAALQGEYRTAALAQLGMMLSATHAETVSSWLSTVPLSEEERRFFTDSQHGMPTDYQLQYFELQDSMTRLNSH